MSNEEAINELRIAEEYIRTQGCLHRGTFEAFAKAIEALERQIPKKAKRIIHHNGQPVIGICPACGRAMERKENCCKICGQAIDWRTNDLH